MSLKEELKIMIVEECDKEIEPSSIKNEDNTLYAKDSNAK